MMVHSALGRPEPCFLFVLAQGTALADIKQETLLNQVKITQFEGISGALAIASKAFDPGVNLACGIHFMLNHTD